MWISREEYNSLKELKKHHNDYVNSLYWQMDQLRSEKWAYQAECAEYKQKYADEVQKRLELIDFYERQNAN